MGIKQQVKRLFGRKKPTHQLQRQSIGYKPQYQSTMNVLSPDETGVWRFKRMDTAQLAYMPVHDILANFAANVAPVSFAVQTYTDSCVPDYEIVGDDRARDAILELIGQDERGDATFLTKLRKAVYSIKVEGGLARELYYDDSGEVALGIGDLSVYDLRWRPIDGGEHGTIYEIFQYDERHQPVPLQSKLNPNPNFVYEPVNVQGNKPYGSSPIAAAIFSILSQMDLGELIKQYLRGQAAPAGIVSVPRAPIAQAGYEDTDEISNIVSQTTDLIDNLLQSGDATQTITVDTEVLYTTLGVLANANLAGLEIIDERLDKELQRALRMPEPVFPSRKTGGLGSGEYRVQWQLWQQDLDATTNTIESVYNKLFTEYLRGEGISEDASLQIERVDIEGLRIRAEAAKMEAEAWDIRVNMGAFTPQQAFEYMIRSNEDLAYLEESDFVPQPEPVEPQPEPEGDDNE